MIDKVKCSFAKLVLGFYVYGKFFPIFQYDLDSFCLPIYASLMQGCISFVIFSIQVNAKVFWTLDN